jgi:hypothetical protein
MKLARKKPKESVYQALVQKYISKHFGCVTVRELNFGGPRFDVVGFSPETEEFYIVECKRTKRPVGIGQTFGQILAYKAMIADGGEKFLNSFNTALVRARITKLQFWQYGTRFVDAGKIPVRFFVAMPQEACERTDILQSIKKDLTGVGIIRIKGNKQCKDYIRVFQDKDYEICRGTPVDVPISMPIRPLVRNFLERKRRDRNVARLVGIADYKIMRLRPGRIRSVAYRDWAIYYRLRTGFLGLLPKQHYVRVTFKEKKGWKHFNITKENQIRRVLSKAKNALARTTQS